MNMMAGLHFSCVFPSMLKKVTLLGCKHPQTPTTNITTISNTVDNHIKVNNTVKTISFPSSFLTVRMSWLYLQGKKKKKQPNIPLIISSADPWIVFVIYVI